MKTNALESLLTELSPSEEAAFSGGGHGYGHCKGRGRGHDKGRGRGHDGDCGDCDDYEEDDDKDDYCDNDDDK
jgi:hypothetical protein